MESDKPTLTDAEAVKSVLDGNRSAYALLVGRYERTVCGVAAGILGDYEAARDVSQDVFFAAYEKLASLKNHSGFGTWLLQIARNRAMSVLRDRSRVSYRSVEPETVSEDGKLDDAAETILKLVDRLPVSERQIVMMRYFDDLSMGEISEVTGRPVGTVTKQLSRARERLRNWLQEKNE